MLFSYERRVYAFIRSFYIWHSTDYGGVCSRLIYRACALYGDRGVACFDTYVLDGYCNWYSLEAYGTKSCIRSGLYYFCEPLCIAVIFDMGVALGDWYLCRFESRRIATYSSILLIHYRYDCRYTFCYCWFYRSCRSGSGHSIDVFFVYW